MSRRRSFIVTLVTAAVTLMLAAPSANAVFGVRMGEGSSVSREGSASPGLYDEAAECPSGMVVTGVDATWDDGSLYLSSLAIDCADLAQDGGNNLIWGGAASGSAAMGYPGDVSGSSSCPTNQVATGFTVRAGAIIDGLEVRCQAFTGTATAGGYTNGAHVGGNGGNGYDDACAAGQFITSIEVYTGMFSGYTIDNIRFNCASVTVAGEFQADLVLNGKTAQQDDVYDDDPAVQKATRRVKPGKTATFTIDVQNDGLLDDVRYGGSGNSKGFKVTYLDSGAADITEEVTDVDGVQVEIAEAGTETFTIKVKVARTVDPGKTYAISMEAAPLAAPDGIDTATAKVKVVKP